MVVGLWVKVMSGDGANVTCLLVRHSSSEPGGGVPLVESKMEGEALGTSLGFIDCMLWSMFGAGVGVGSDGGNALVHATNGGGTTAVGPQPRHSLLVTSVSVVGVSIVRSVRESYSHAVQSI